MHLGIASRYAEVAEDEQSKKRDPIHAPSIESKRKIRRGRIIFEGEVAEKKKMGGTNDSKRERKEKG